MLWSKSFVAMGYLSLKLVVNSRRVADRWAACEAERQACESVDDDIVCCSPTYFSRLDAEPDESGPVSVLSIQAQLQEGPEFHVVMKDYAFILFFLGKKNEGEIPLSS
jgi:hypothetical protein